MGLKVAVIGGGESQEAEISRISSREVLAGLQLSHTAEYFEFDDALVKNLNGFEPDVAIPVMHGPHGEDGTVQGFLSSLQIPFVGSDLHSSALGMDKHVSKLLFEDVGLPVIPGVLVPNESLEEKIPLLHQQLGESLVVKPVNQGSALGVTLLPNGGDLMGALKHGFEYGDRVLVEPFHLGREITVGVLDLYEHIPKALPIIDIVVGDDEWYDFTNRYAQGKSKHVIPPDGLADETLEELAKTAIQAHQTLGCADLSRSDYIVAENGEFWLLEVNTMPGMTPTSLYPDAARAYGLDFPTLLDQLVDSGYRRGLR